MTGRVLNNLVFSSGPLTTLYSPPPCRHLFRPISLLRRGGKGSLWVTNPLISITPKAVGAQCQTQGKRLNEFPWFTWPSGDLYFFPGNVLPDIHAKPPGLVHLVAVKNCRNLSHSEPVLFCFPEPWLVLTSLQNGTVASKLASLPHTPGSFSLISTYHVSPFHRGPAQKGEGKDLRSWPDQLSINNVTVEPWLHVMSKAFKTSPVLISRTPKEKS